MKISHNKLVRDKIPKIIERDNCSCKYHIADEKEFEVKLFEKLQEEIGEFTETPTAEEMADILEVLDAIRKHYDIDLTAVKYQKESKYVNRGGFSAKLILEWTKVNS